MDGSRLPRAFFISAFVALTFSFGPLPSLVADSLQLLVQEESALQTRLDLIDQAVCSIDIATFQLSDDATGGQIISALVDAAARGVSVRILVDAHPGSNNLPKPLMSFLLQRGLEIRERPVDVRYQIDIGRPRLHDKLFLIDRSVLIIGGRNIEQEFFGIGCERYVDLDLLYTGCQTDAIACYFDQRWNECVTGQPRLSGREPHKSMKKQKHQAWNHLSREEATIAIESWLSERATSPLAACNFPCHRDIEYPALDVESSCVEFLHDCVGGLKSNPAAISQRIHQAIRSARRCVTLSTPYFVLTPTFEKILNELVDRGIQVRVITNSLESTDQVVAHAGYVNARRRLLRRGIQLFEYQGPHTLHTKLIMIDNRVSIVGSHNLDPLSERRNSEVALLIRDSAVAAQVASVQQELFRQSQNMSNENLLRYEARESDANPKELHEFQRLRLATPFIKKYL